MIRPLGQRETIAFAACLIAAAVSAGTAAVQPRLSAPTTRPATRPVAKPDLPTRLQWHTDGRVEALDSPEPEHCAQAQEDILRLQQTLLEALMRHADSKDLEVRLRVRELIGEMATDTRVWRVLFKLPPDQRAKVRLLRRRRPEWFNEILAPSWSRRVQAVKQLAKPGSDPDHLAEPFLVLLLRHPSAELVAATIEAITAGEYRSDATIEALADLVAKTWRQDPAWRQFSYPRTPFSPRAAALEALGALPSRLAAPRLLSLLLTNESMDMQSNVPLAEVIGATGELRAIPLLIRHLDPTRRLHGWPFAGVRGGTTFADFPFLVLLRLTGQAPASYGFLHLNYYGMTYIGFADGTDRRRAYAKFKKWWEANRDKPPYKGLRPLVLPGESAAPRDSRPVPASPSPASRQPVDAEKLHDDLATRVDELVGRLGARRLRERERAHSKLLGMYRAFLECLVAHADRASSAVREQLFDILTDAVAASRLRKAQATLPSPVWKRLADLQRQSPLILRDAFSLSWQRRVRAMDAARQLADPQGLAEPLVLQGLRDPMPQVVVAAAKAAQNGRFGSDELVEALTDILIRMPRDAWYSDWPGFGRTADQTRPHVAAVAALGKVKNPRSAEVLLSLLADGRSTNPYRDAMLAEALGLTGDRRAIPALLSRLGQTGIIRSWDGRTAGSLATSDIALLALVRLTGQDPKKYKFHKSPHGEPLHGFRGAEERKAAIGQFKAWWRQNESSPRYRNIKPIQIQRLRK